MPKGIYQRKSPAVRLFTRSRSDGECRRWTGPHDKDGYGVITVNRKTVKVHRFAWQMERGPIPEGLLVCHTCDVRDCFKSEHLFLGTPADNIRDMDRKGRRSPIPYRVLMELNEAKANGLRAN